MNIFHVSQISSLEALEAEASRLEADYVFSPVLDRYSVWQRVLRAEQTKKALLYSQQTIFEYGDKNGCLLAWLAKSQTALTHIATIRDVRGRLTSHTGSHKHPLSAPF